MQSHGGLKWRRRKRTWWRKRESIASYMLAFSFFAGRGGERPADGLSFHGKSWTRTFFTDKNFNSFRRRRRDKEEKFVVFCGDGCFKRQRARPGKSYVPPPLLLLLLLFLTSSFQTLEIYHFRTLLLPFLPPFLFSSYFDSFHFQMDSSSINRGRRNLLNSAKRIFGRKF